MTKPLIISTRDICIRDAKTPETVSKVMEKTATQITKALRAIQGGENMTVSFHNIQAEETNPDSDQVFFRVKNIPDGLPYWCLDVGRIEE